MCTTGCECLQICRLLDDTRLQLELFVECGVYPVRAQRVEPIPKGESRPKQFELRVEGQINQEPEQGQEAYGKLYDIATLTYVLPEDWKIFSREKEDNQKRFGKKAVASSCGR